MKDVITKWADFGASEVDVKKVCDQWNDDDCVIIKLQDEYKLSRYSGDEKLFKVEISETQAKEIIHILGLIYTPSSIFRNSGTYRLTYGER